MGYIQALGDISSKKHTYVNLEFIVGEEGL